MAQRLAPYLSYYSSHRPADDQGRRPLVLVVFDDPVAPTHFLEVARREMARVRVPLPLLASHRNCGTGGTPGRSVAGARRRLPAGLCLSTLTVLISREKGMADTTRKTPPRSTPDLPMNREESHRTPKSGAALKRRQDIEATSCRMRPRLAAKGSPP